jgi:hypothetical protein
MISYCDNKMADKWESADRDKYKEIVQNWIRQLFGGGGAGSDCKKREYILMGMWDALLQAVVTRGSIFT